MGFAFVLPKIWVKPGGFHSDLWQSLKPAGFHAMSCGKVQNPPGFAPCRVAKSKTRRVLRYVVWQSPKPAGFYAMSCGRVQNPPGFTLCRVAKSKTRRVLRHVVWRNAKPIGRQAVGAYCIRSPGVSGRKRLSKSIPNKLGYRVFRSLAGTFEGRMQYAPTRVRSFGSLHVPGQIRRRPQTPVCNTPLPPDTCLEFLRSAGR